MAADRKRIKGWQVMVMKVGKQIFFTEFTKHIERVHEYYRYPSIHPDSFTPLRTSKRIEAWKLKV